MAALTFLELAQGVARESGTVAGRPLTSVADQTGRLLKVVNWTAEAWRLIQIAETAWKWMVAELPATALTSAGTSAYTATGWGFGSRFGRWVEASKVLTIYDTDIGVADEGEVTYVRDWATFRDRWKRGVQTNGRPQEWAVSPDGEIVFGPVPDAEYRVRSLYRKNAQILAANGDIPECNEDYHPIIKWRGVMLLSEHDEVPPTLLAAATRNYYQYMSTLRRDQRQQVSFGSRPLA